MNDQDLKFGDEPRELRPDRLDILDPRAHHEALPAPSLLTHERLAGGYRIEASQESADGLPARRRCRDDAELLQAHEGSLQGSRNGCRRQCQDMDTGSHAPELFLVGYAEPLL